MELGNRTGRLEFTGKRMTAGHGHGGNLGQRLNCQWYTGGIAAGAAPPGYRAIAAPSPGRVRVVQGCSRTRDVTVTAAAGKLGPLTP